MAKELKNKVILITGGARGIGYEIADKFLTKEAKAVILIDINEAQGNEAVDNLKSKHGDNKAAFINCDVTTDLDVIDKIMSQYKHIDVLVNSAGITGGFSVTKEEHNRKTIEVNVTALMLWSMKVWEHMRKDRNGNGGTIINLGSIYGIKPNPFIPVYVTSKHAVVGFSKSLGHKYNFDRSGVRVVTICPGYTETSMTASPKDYFEEEMQRDVMEYFSAQVWQKVEAVGKAAVDVFENADSGTVWLIDNGVLTHVTDKVY